MDLLSMLGGLTDLWRGNPPKPPTLSPHKIGAQHPTSNPEEERLGLSNCTHGNHPELLVCGDKAFPAILEAVEQAQHHVHLQALLFFDDAAGRQLSALLQKKAAQGVEIRVLFEHLTTAVGDPMMHKGLSPLSVAQLSQRMKDHGILVRDSATFPLELLDFTEADLLLNQLKRIAQLERNTLPKGWRQEHLALQQRFLSQAETLLKNETFRKTLNSTTAFIDKLNAHFSPWKTPLRYLRQFLLHDHRKIIVIDGHTAFCGGMNIGQEYLYLHPYDPNLPADDDAKREGNPEPWPKWHDVCVKVKGPVVNQLQAQFLHRWLELEPDHNSLHTQQTHLSTPPYLPTPAHPGNSRIWLHTQRPTQSDELEQRLLQEIMGAKESVRLCNPYLVRDSFVGALLAKGQHTQIQLLMPDDHNDSFIHQAFIRGCYDWYDKANFDVHEYQNHFTHAKVLLVDDQLTHIGSFNFNNRSALLDFECSLLIDDADFAKDARQQIFEAPIQAGHTQTMHHSIKKLTDIDLVLGARAIFDLLPEVL